jgi:hypothetical protein
MSDFLQAVSDHLNRTPSLCICGHPSVLHAEGVGCLGRFEHDSGVDLCPCEVGKYAPPGPDPRLEGTTAAPTCSGAHPDAGPYWGNSTVNLTYLARGIQEHDSGSDVCPCEEGR